MKPNFSKLKLCQLDATLARSRAAELPVRPPSGWLKAIREALGMTATQLARRLSVVTSTVTRLETSEADDTISLATLRRAAEALDCGLRYVLEYRDGEHMARNLDDDEKGMQSVCIPPQAGVRSRGRSQRLM